MTAALVLGIAILIPHVLRLDRAVPSVAASIWLSALLLRALLATLAAVSLLALLPGSSPFNALSGWCWNTTLPFLATHLGISGARLGQAVTLMPLVLLVAWGGLRVAQITRSHRSTKRMLREATLGTGPAGSLIVGGSSVIVAAAGLLRPDVILSARALTELDDEELAAGIAHEQGHIVRRHRWWLALADVCRSVGRLIPGTRLAMEQFRFHLERDADQWAVDRSHSRLALASAICKVGSGTFDNLSFALDGSNAVGRVDELIAPGESRINARAQKLATVISMLLVVLAISFASAVPTATAAGVKHLESHSSSTPCPL